MFDGEGDQIPSVYNDGGAPGANCGPVIGGAKVSTKLPLLESLLDKADVILLGGGLAFTFYRAMGISVGNSIVEEDQIPLAKTILVSGTRIA